jgi:hypothetical protein
MPTPTGETDRHWEHGPGGHPERVSGTVVSTVARLNDAQATAEFAADSKRIATPPITIYAATQCGCASSGTEASSAGAHPSAVISV